MKSGKGKQAKMLPNCKTVRMFIPIDRKRIKPNIRLKYFTSLVLEDDDDDDESDAESTLSIWV